MGLLWTRSVLASPSPILLTDGINILHSLQFFMNSLFISLLYKSQWYTEWQQIDKPDMISTHAKISCLITFLFCPFNNT